MPHPADSEIGARIRQRRLLLGMDQKTLAAALGVSFQQVQKYENAANRVSASQMKGIAEALKVPIQYFFDELGDADKLDPAERKLREQMRRPEALRLIRVFCELPDQEARQAFVALVKDAAVRR